MSDWSHGYDVSMSYSYGFYREMAPDWLDLCAWIGGFDPPERRASYRYLDLGCGQGFGVCLLAAANPHAEFVGIDFQPEHVAHAQGLAEAAGLANVRFVQADFLDLADDWPAELGSFEYVALHGIISWVSPALREAVLKCLSQATADGGLVYVSYNAHPGCLSTIPLQHFSWKMKESNGDQGAAAVEASIALLDALADANAPVFQVLPALKARLEELKGRDKNYLVHEYLTESWTPFWHSEVARRFRNSGLDYVGSATLADNLIMEVLPAAFRNVVTEQSNADLRQDLQDCVINQAFRRDIYCRGAKPLGSRNSAPKDAVPLYLMASIEGAPSLNFATSFGQINWDRPVFQATVEAMRRGPRALAELLRLTNQTPWTPRLIVLLLLHCSVLAPGAAQPGDVSVAQRLNALIARAVAEGAPYEYLAAASLGSAIRPTRAELALLDAWLGSKSAASVPDLARKLETRLAGRGRALDGDPHSIAAAFIADTLPRWRQLGVVQ